MSKLFEILSQIYILSDHQELSDVVTAIYKKSKTHKKYPLWMHNLQKISSVNPATVSVKSPYIAIENLENYHHQSLLSQLRSLAPWRKGPYQLGSIIIDSEWQGWMKWERLKNYLPNLNNQQILDVGAGNGYFSYQMALNGAKQVWALEPYLLYNYQFFAIQSLIQNKLPIIMLPIKLEMLTVQQYFDIVFSMGVLYHQKSPIEHLKQLRNKLKKSGMLVLETLIIDGELGNHLLPKDRYAKMRNVWFIPSVLTMISYLERCGFEQIKCVNVNQTTRLEQHRTLWLGDNPESLEDFLNPDNPNQTIEGYPAPKRAVFICHKAD